MRILGSNRTGRRHGGRAGLAVAVVAALALSACKSNHLHTGSVPTDGYRTNYPIIVTEAPETLDIPVGSATRSLSPDLAGRIKAFAADARARGDGGMEILVPSGSANETAAMAVARQIRGVVGRAGVPGEMISAHTYTVDDPDALAPIRLSYLRIKAVAKRCGLWRRDLTDDFQNRGYSEFGCAYQRNFAAIVADPADLIHPRAAKPGDPARRGTVFEKYRKGEQTATDYGDDGQGQVAQVSGGG